MDIRLTPEERTAIEEVPTESYLALLAYCRGLEYEDQGDYGNAESAFSEAASEDSGFSEAQTQAEVAGEIVALGGEGDQGTFDAFEAAVSSTTTENLGQQDYLSTIVVNTNFVPSDEPGGAAENETANIPDTGIVGPVNVTVVGEINGSR